MSTGTLLNDNDREAILARLRRVRPDTPARWGKLDAAGMLCHITDQLRVATGELASNPTHTFLYRTLVKWIVIQTGVQPPPGKVQTAPEMLTSRPGEWAADMASCERLIVAVGAGKASAVHPAFGPLNSSEWGKLCWKHLDHHLRQFGQ
ncbi:MAG TPA: DUF1569 domain-containing protein [Thermoanaerobaculia bacterium]